MPYYFKKLDRARADEILPQLFRILHTNMSRLLPTGNSYSEDEAIWLSYAMPRLNDPYPETVLMYDGSNLVGYCQYSISNQSMLVEEVEIQPEYQRTLLFFCFCNYLCRELPMEINYIESYVNKQNTNSLRINQKIGLSIIEESKSGNSWHLRGRVEDILNYFYRLDRQGSGASEDAP